MEPLLDANPPLDVFDSAAVGRTRGLEELLEAEPALAKSWSADGFTALHLAAFFGEEDAGEDPARERCRGESRRAPRDDPRRAAAQRRCGRPSGIVKLLLEHGAEANAAQDGGFTPLHSAAQNDDRESVEALLEAGADPFRLANDEGKTPPDFAGDETRDLLLT